MENALLRLIYQRRFKLMNRWSADAMYLQPKFDADGDFVFRSMIFKAFNAIVKQVRCQEKQDEAAGTALLDQMEFSKLPDLASCQRVWRIGEDLIQSFCAEDPTCIKRFSIEERTEVRRQVKEAVKVILERETSAYKRLSATEKPASQFCTQCGRALEGS